MVLHRQLAIAGCLVLAACNQSDSHDIQADRLILKAQLYAQDQAVIKATLGKEHSTVVVVLNGGDFLEVSDGRSRQIMEFHDNLINDVHYRAALPLSLNKGYTLTLNRASQHQLYTSIFPIIPENFAITFPTDLQTFSLTSTPSFTLFWDTKLRSNDVLLRTDYSCHWAVTPIPTGNSGDIQNSTNNEITLNTSQRDARSAFIDVQQIVSALKNEILSRYPQHEVSMQNCNLKLEIAAQNHAMAHSGLSEQSQLSSIREQAVNINFQP